MRQKKLEDAVKIFEYNAKRFPNSANVFDSLAEGYYNSGDKVNALANYQKALKLDPKLDSALQMVKALSN